MDIISDKVPALVEMSQAVVTPSKKRYRSDTKVSVDNPTVETAMQNLISIQNEICKKAIPMVRKRDSGLTTFGPWVVLASQLTSQVVALSQGNASISCSTDLLQHILGGDEDLEDGNDDYEVEEKTPHIEDTPLGKAIKSAMAKVDSERNEKEKDLLKEVLEPQPEPGTPQYKAKLEKEILEIMQIPVEKRSYGQAIALQIAMKEMNR